MKIVLSNIYQKIQQDKNLKNKIKIQNHYIKLLGNYNNLTIIVMNLKINWNISIVIVK